MKQKEEEKKIHEFLGHPGQIVPKFSNGFNFAALSNNQVIITFTYKEGEQPPILIDRVIVDQDHAKKIQQVLNKFLNDLEKKDGTTTNK